MGRVRVKENILNKRSTPIEQSAVRDVARRSWKGRGFRRDLFSFVLLYFLLFYFTFFSFYFCMFGVCRCFGLQKEGTYFSPLRVVAEDRQKRNENSNSISDTNENPDVQSTHPTSTKGWDSNQQLC